MSFRWVVLLLLSMLLLSCQSSNLNQENDMHLEKKVENETSDNLFYISDSVHPYYVVLDKNYSESAKKIFVGETLKLSFENPEKIVDFTVFSEEVLQLKISFENKDFNLSVEKGENIFNLPSDDLVDSVNLSLISGPKSGFSIADILIQGYIQLDEVDYIDYTTKKAWIMTLQKSLDWAEDPMDNLKLIPDLKVLFKDQQLNIYGEAVDFKMLESTSEDWIGFPVLLTGPVTAYEIYDNYTKVEMKTGLTQTPVIIYFDDFDSSLDYITAIGIFLGLDEQLKFYSSARLIE